MAQSGEHLRERAVKLPKPQVPQRRWQPVVEPDFVTAILAGQAVANITIVALYSFLRLRKEERKVKAAEAAAAASAVSAAASKASFDAMTVYHAKRLEIEERKLELARKPQVPERP